MLAFEESREWLFASLDDNTIAHPLPKLRLCCPKLFLVFADDECCLFLPFLLRAHREYTSALAYFGHTQKPLGEASLARQHQIFKLLKTEFSAPVTTIWFRNRRVCNSALLMEGSGRSRILSGR